MLMNLGTGPAKELVAPMKSLPGSQRPSVVQQVLEMAEVVGEIEAGAEGASGAAQDDDTHFGIAIRLDHRALQFVGHGRHDGVESIRSVQRDRRDRTIAFVEDRLVGHRHTSVGIERSGPHSPFPLPACDSQTKGYRDPSMENSLPSASGGEKGAGVSVPPARFGGRFATPRTEDLAGLLGAGSTCCTGMNTPVPKPSYRCARTVSMIQVIEGPDPTH